MKARCPVRKSRRGSRRLRGDSGQLLLLAGMILVIGFITTAVALNQLGTLQKQVTEDQQTPLLTEYRFFRNRVGTSLEDATTTSTDEDTFKAIFDSMHDTFRRMAQEKGYDFEVTLAANGLNLEKTEWSYTSWGWPDRLQDGTTTWWHNGGSPYDSGVSVDIDDDGIADDPTDANPYWLYSHDDLVDLTYGSRTEHWDGTDDGIVNVQDCVVDPGNQCIQAAVVYLYMADSRASIEEYVVYSLNAN